MSIIKIADSCDVCVIKHNNKNWFMKTNLFKECNISCRKLLKCSATTNAKTITIIGINQFNQTILWCITRHNKQWHVLATQIGLSKIRDISLSMSTSGNTIFVGLPENDNYNGECIVY